jgi:hypothetical protein
MQDENKMSTAQECLAFSGLFEAELLNELMLRHWAHPLANDVEFRNYLLEGAAEALRESVAGEQLADDIPPNQMNFVAALWLVEWNALANGAEDPDGLRSKWLDMVKKTVPSCFCNPDRLN